MKYSKYKSPPNTTDISFKCNNITQNILSTQFWIRYYYINNSSYEFFRISLWMSFLKIRTNIFN